MKPLALRWRISICAALMLITAIGVIWIIAYIEFQGLLLRYIDDTLLVVSRGNISIMDDAPDASEPAEIRALMVLSKRVPSMFTASGWTISQKTFIPPSLQRKAVVGYVKLSRHSSPPHSETISSSVNNWDQADIAPSGCVPAPFVDQPTSWWRDLATFDRKSFTNF